MTPPAQAPSTPLVHRLANGVRVLVLREPAWPTASVSVFVRSGSAHEPRALAGISHVVEHMAFKGTRSRDARQINLDAERLGAEVNAHTDKDHTAFQMRGLARDAAHFVEQLADIVLHSTFPADELERERQVLLHEFADDEDDPMSEAYKLFDHACFGLHPAAQPVIGTRRNVERFGRDDLLQYVERQYSGANVIVAAAGDIDCEHVLRAAETAFAGLRAGPPNVVEPPAWGGGVRSRRHGETGQAHLVLGFAVPGLADDPLPEVLAAAVFGEGMSSPLLHRLREQRALAYHATCAADVMDGWGQFVVEVSTAPAQLEEVTREVATLLRDQLRGVEPQDLERARCQLLVRRLQDHERALKRLEEAALDLFVHGRIRSTAEWQSRLMAVTSGQVRQAFESMIGRGVAAAAVGPLPRAAGERLRSALAPLDA